MPKLPASFTICVKWNWQDRKRPVFSDKTINLVHASVKGEDNGEKLCSKLYQPQNADINPISADVNFLCSSVLQIAVYAEWSKNTLSKLIALFLWHKAFYSVPICTSQTPERRLFPLKAPLLGFRPLFSPNQHPHPEQIAYLRWLSKQITQEESRSPTGLS